MNRILVLLAHPHLSQSKANKQMAAMSSTLQHVTLVDLYAHYPRFKIDIEAEQQRLREHDVIVLQFPTYWYSTPSLLKEWQDLVLEFGFAYGDNGNHLAGKSLLLVTTAGAPELAYTPQGSNQFSIRSLFAPLEQTAALCQMHFLPPFVLFSSVAARLDGRIAQHVQQYRLVLELLRTGQLDTKNLAKQELLDPTSLPLLTESDRLQGA